VSARDWARRFAAGYRVALISRKADYLNQLAQTITTDGGVRLPEMRVIEAMAGG
jgi:short-subunit dehydrogenase